ncbi:hypothetical protein JXD20_01180 [Candidatus Peregrinibacteria bacterium]|nr:hypothetical protein [Candidatus Peregrinibacteria bacterium]
MKTLEKITSGLLLTGIFLLTFATTTFAQNEFNALDAIKAKLEGEGISVIDYSKPTQAWGSLPQKWEDYMINKDFERLSGFAATFEDDFIGEFGLTALRRQLGTAEAAKSGMTDTEELENQQLMIDGLKEDIEDLEFEIKDDIGNALGNTGSLNKEEGINLLFHEIDFYFNYSKWGPLPNRIIGVLENEGYTSLQDLADSQLVGDEEVMIRLPMRDLLSNVEELSSDDIALIEDSLAIVQAEAEGESQINLITRSIANTIKNLLIGIAVLWIVYAGTRMVFAQGDENIITEQKRAIMYAGVGLVAVLLADRGIDYLYGPAGVQRTELIKDVGFSNEIYGLVNFIKALIGTIAILFIVISGAQILFAAGEEDVITKQKKSLLWVGVGLILIAIDKILIEQIFVIPTQEQSDQIRTSNITSIINTIGSVIQFLLGFVGLVAFAALVYGAATMIINYGNDEMVEKSKKIIRNAIIGIIVVLSAYVIVATLVVFR